MPSQSRKQPLTLRTEPSDFSKHAPLFLAARESRNDHEAPQTAQAIRIPLHLCSTRHSQRMCIKKKQMHTGFSPSGPQIARMMFIDASECGTAQACDVEPDCSHAVWGR